MRDDFDRLLEEELKNPEFQKEWNVLEPEFNIIQAMIDARKNSHLTQKELAQKTGINQADISKLENGNANPTLSLLQRLAEGMDMQLKLEFIPKQEIVVK
ncbi:MULTISPECIES: helix-turn-helix domain-containing protein [Anaerotignum]|uniref:Antitoxin HigA n=1 Tax=Anaerotignum propionicum DSM 1682 TaxID=991789 RepID=A0A0X1U941_ANAPI|nr:MULTISPECIES: helix-turn-helix transcriptional regulator [Anaerotignum]AMJ41456.1 antitoxin HigA [Anaerotignum propionicum DSM 1682]SHE68901.1 transcriptional regulator, XRE family [[Clostridium] propionicum DSM 1682] [Anaerotignum propionicum DSM 1682]